MFNASEVKHPSPPPGQPQPEIGKTPVKKVTSHILPSLAPHEIEEVRAGGGGGGERRTEGERTLQQEEISDDCRGVVHPF